MVQLAQRGSTIPQVGVQAITMAQLATRESTTALEGVRVTIVAQLAPQEEIYGSGGGTGDNGGPGGAPHMVIPSQMHSGDTATFRVTGGGSGATYYWTCSKPIVGSFGSPGAASTTFTLKKAQPGPPISVVITVTVNGKALPPHNLTILP